VVTQMACMRRSWMGGFVEACDRKSTRQGNFAGRGGIVVSQITYMRSSR